MTVDDVQGFPSSKARNLGVMLYSNLTIESHINNPYKKAYFHLRRITPIRRHFSSSVLIQLICVFVLSQVNYGNALLYGLPASRLTKLQRFLNAAERLIHQIKRRDSVAPALRSLHWLPVSQQIEFKIAVMVSPA